MMDRRILLAVLCSVALGRAAEAQAQSYPVRPIKLVVPFPAGGPADLFARVFAAEATVALGQPVVVENHGGVGGLSGVDVVAKSSPDGYTFGIAGSGALATMPFMVPAMPFDWRHDLTLLTLIVRVPEVLAVHPSLPVSSVKELVDYARANPGRINFGSAGNGTLPHLAVELLKTAAGIELVHVPYRGAAPAVNDLLGGHVQLVVLDVPVLLPHIQSGGIKAIAVTSATRSAAIPDVPTTGEAGFATVLSDNWYGLVAPAALPADVLRKLHSGAMTALRSTELVRQFKLQNAIPSPTTQSEFTSFVLAELERWEPIVHATGAKPN